ncbi:hypothetical protein [Paraburkholderia sp. SOS3]|uniref:hypothetical protein n=1 Tax=Paraburkholderia sp. SOS3 TaxID=1926494 RepID=UPI0009475FA2|nr:hypothetical protein [Paraburkholderia sp. SOS3]APR35703.1 hypothetical protein BTO02_10050 [Paraburkholderia sp. SOS3]
MDMIVGWHDLPIKTTSPGAYGKDLLFLSQFTSSITLGEQRLQFLGGDRDIDRQGGLDRRTASLFRGNIPASDIVVSR